LRIFTKTARERSARGKQHKQPTCLERSARYLFNGNRQNIEEKEIPEHFDLWLKKALDEAGQKAWGAESSIGACCVIPPVGCYQTHESGCEKDMVRKEMFCADHMQEGTRKRPSNPDDEERHLYRFSSFGSSICITRPGDFDFPNKLPDLQWTTLSPRTCQFPSTYRRGPRKTVTIFPTECVVPANVNLKALTGHMKRVVRYNQQLFSRRIFTRDPDKAFSSDVPFTIIRKRISFKRVVGVQPKPEIV